MTFATEDWVDVGIGTFNDMIFSDATVEVTIQQSASNPNIYRIPDAWKGTGVSSVQPLIFDATDPECVLIEKQSTGLYFSGYSSVGYILSASWYYYSAGYSLATIKAALPDDCITLANGTLSIPASSIYINFADNKSYASKFYTITDQASSIIFPGGKDYSFAVENPLCDEDNVIEFNITKGADISAVYFANLDEALYVGSDVLYQQVVGLAQAVPASGKITFNAEPGGYTFFFAAVNANGEIVASQHCYCYGIDNSDDDWTSLGEADYTDDIIASGYSDVDNSTYKVEVQENNVIKGYYRIVNPYGTAFIAAAGITNRHTDTHNHYMYIDASDAERVYIPDSPIGTDLGYGAGRVMSIAYMYMANEYTNEEIDEEGVWGKKEGNTITFPTNSLLLSEANYKQGAWDLANGSGKFSIEIPASGIAAPAISVADGAVEYFNLQGIKVDNPQVGGLYIRRQGTQAAKVIMK